VPTVAPGQRAAAVRAELSGRRFQDISHVFVVDDGRLVGAIPIATLVTAGPHREVRELIEPGACPIVSVAEDREAAATAAIRQEASALAVCDADGHFRGIVSAGSLMSILRDEHLEDLHHMAGILARSENARRALTAPPGRRAAYRLPWLLMGMAGSAVAILLMSRFESLLATDIALAFFVPAIVYLADAVGTQSEAVAVRAISLSSGRLLPLVVGELATGVLIGAILGGLAYMPVWLAFASAPLAATVAISLFIACGIAASLGFLLPWMFARLGFDPAIGSGPIGTVIQDIVSIAVYLLVAMALL
jgi:magnesium transporter